MKTATALAIAALLATAPGLALAKAHDNGVADGSPSGNANFAGKAAATGDGNPLADAVNEGARGMAASEAKSGNRIEPVH